MTPLPRGAVGRWRGWGLGVSALELARWCGWAADTPARSWESYQDHHDHLHFPQHHSPNQGTPAPKCRGLGWGVISDQSIRCPGSWTLDAGCWQPDIMPDSAVTHRPSKYRAVRTL